MDKKDSSLEIITEETEKEGKKNPLTVFIDFFKIKNIDKIVKVISFVISIAILVAFVFIAVVLAMFDKFFMIISIVILILGLIISLINLFILYGMGHILTQNNKIISLLEIEDQD